jgi:hypothetical protein
VIENVEDTVCQGLATKPRRIEHVTVDQSLSDRGVPTVSWNGAKPAPSDRLESFNTHGGIDLLDGSW